MLGSASNYLPCGEGSKGSLDFAGFPPRNMDVTLAKICSLPRHTIVWTSYDVHFSPTVVCALRLIALSRSCAVLLLHTQPRVVSDFVDLQHVWPGTQSWWRGCVELGKLPHRRRSRWEDWQKDHKANQRQANHQKWGEGQPSLLCKANKEERYFRKFLVEQAHYIHFGLAALQR